MRAYELVVIFDGELDDVGVDASIARVDAAIRDKSGTIATTAKWGKRRFAYEINHRHDGYYAVFEVLADAGALDDLERQLRLADDVVRHKLIRLPEREAARRGLVTDEASPVAAG